MASAAATVISVSVSATEGLLIADLVVGELNAGQIKTGHRCRVHRTAKPNQPICTRKIWDVASYAGADVFARSSAKRCWWRVSRSTARDWRDGRHSSPRWRHVPGFSTLWSDKGSRYVRMRLSRSCRPEGEERRRRAKCCA